MSGKKWLQILFALFSLCTIVVSIRFYTDLQGLQKAKSLRAEVLSQIEIGMSRSEVEPIVQKAKVHYHCQAVTFSDDYYLFDPDPNRAVTISLRFEPTEQGEILTAIYDVEYYLVEAYTSHCVKDP